MTLDLHPAIPMVLPAGWGIVDRWGDGYRVLHRTGIRCILSTAPFPDGREWLHISCSRENRIPSWDDMKFVKETFARDKLAVQVFPPPEEYVNEHPFCLHLWVPLTGERPLPDFRFQGSI